MKSDASQPPSPQNNTLFRVETRPREDTLHVDPAGIDAFGSELPETVAAVSVAPNLEPLPPGPATRSARRLVRALAAVALLEAIVIAGLLVNGSAFFDTRDGRLVIESDPSGAEVWLDGRHLGTTPLSLMAGAGERSLRIDAHGTSRTMKVDVANGQVTHARVDFVKVSDAAFFAVPLPSVGHLTPPAAPPKLPAPDTTSPPLPSAASARSVERGWIDVPAAHVTVNLRD